MKTPGVSLTAVARPTSTPPARRRDSSRQSTAHISTSSSSTCPNLISSRSGSICCQRPRQHAGCKRPPPAEAAQQWPERQGSDGRGGQHLTDRPHPAGGRERQDRQRGREQCCERRVGEGQALRRVPDEGVEVASVQHGSAGAAVDVEIDKALRRCRSRDVRRTTMRPRPHTSRRPTRKRRRTRAGSGAHLKHDNDVCLIGDPTRRRARGSGCPRGRHRPALPHRRRPAVRARPVHHFAGHLCVAHAPLDEVGDSRRYQHHPVVAGLKQRCEQQWLDELTAIGLPDGIDAADPIGAMRALAARDRLPTVYKWLARSSVVGRRRQLPRPRGRPGRRVRRPRCDLPGRFVRLGQDGARRQLLGRDGQRRPRRRAHHVARPARRRHRDAPHPARGPAGFRPRARGVRRPARDQPLAAAGDARRTRADRAAGRAALPARAAGLRPLRRARRRRTRSTRCTPRSIRGTARTGWTRRSCRRSTERPAWGERIVRGALWRSAVNARVPRPTSPRSWSTSTCSTDT